MFKRLCVRFNCRRRYSQKVSFVAIILVNTSLPPMKRVIVHLLQKENLLSSIHLTNCRNFFRYIAVTQPIKYAKHKNNRRVWMTIALVWVISATIGSPIVLGLNNTPDRVEDACLFYNSDFIIYSSLSSFYIPCIIMVFLYYNIFKVSKCRYESLTTTTNHGPLLNELMHE